LLWNANLKEVVFPAQQVSKGMAVIMQHVTVLVNWADTQFRKLRRSLRLSQTESSDSVDMTRRAR
jgi:hypothetical protein